MLAEEEKFFHNPEDFYGLETSVKHATETFSATFIGEVLNFMNTQICENSVRKRRYITQRTDKRTIISFVAISHLIALTIETEKTTAIIICLKS